MSKVVSIINMKGGVGKSTLTVNLAWHYAVTWSKKVLVVDLDPQFNASQYLLGVSEYESVLNGTKSTICELFEVFEHLDKMSPQKKIKMDDELLTMLAENAVHPVSTSSYYGNKTIFTGGKVDLIPSKLDLAFSIRNPASKEFLLAKALSHLKKHYDLILIDCAPTESVLTTAAYLASDYLLVPVKP